MSVSLRTFQEDMRRLLVPGGAAASRSAVWGDAVPDRLRVYRNNVSSNWADTLDVDFRLTKAQFAPEAWTDLRARYFAKHPAGHWELNASVSPFVKFLSREKAPAAVKELADFEWNDLAVFIHRAAVKKGAGVTNPTAVARVYRHQLFFWVRDGAPRDRPPAQKPEVLLFYRDPGNSCHIIEADPLMLLVMEHFRTPRARLEDLEADRRRLLPANDVPLARVLEDLKDKDIIL